MSELSGTLDGVGLPAIVRFLTGLRKTGRLNVLHEAWHGELYFESGELRNAILGTRRGLPALDAMVQSVGDGSFTFEADADRPAIGDINLSTDALERHLDDLLEHRTEAPRLPALESVPSFVEQSATAATEEPCRSIAARCRRSCGRRPAHRARNHHPARLVRRAVAARQPGRGWPGDASTGLQPQPPRRRADEPATPAPTSAPVELPML